MIKSMQMVVNRVAKLSRADRKLFSLLVALLLVSTTLTSCESSQSSQTGSGTAMEDASAPEGMWPSYYAPEFLEHGYAGEVDTRNAAIAAARAAGLNCIRLDGTTPPNDEVAMFVLYFKSPIDGHMLDKSENSWWKAHDAGITRWVIDLGDGSQMGRWKFLTRDYPPQTIQWIVNGAVVAQ
ncbi:MAG: hypothetical protein NTY53_20985 [Kiritimatiellaeota bacterium]|nr:hypothetical protein [Kiritimatiellota bacterium]